jgi:hypothetical protein
LELLELAGLKNLQTLAIVGTSKNAGKTTCLNHIIAAWRDAGITRPLALTSIGRDGEDEDVVSGRGKPRIYVYAGTLLATAENAMHRSDALLDVLALSGVRTAFGEIVICRAISDGYIELAGPSSANDLAQIDRLLRQIAPDCLYIIDGALSRRSQAGGGITQNIILATSGETSAIPSELAEHVAHTLELLSLPELNLQQRDMLNDAISQSPDARVISLASKNGQTQIQKLKLPTLLGHSFEIAALISEGIQHLFLRGAITDEVINELLKDKHFRHLTLSVEDGTRLFINSRTLKRLKSRKINCAVLHPLQVNLICFNPSRSDGALVDPMAMQTALRQVTNIPVVDLGTALV